MRLEPPYRLVVAKPVFICCYVGPPLGEIMLVKLILRPFFEMVGLSLGEKMLVKMRSDKHSVGDYVITCVTLTFVNNIKCRGDTNLYMIDTTLNNLFASA